MILMQREMLLALGRLYFLHDGLEIYASAHPCIEGVGSAAITIFGGTNHKYTM